MKKREDILNKFILDTLQEEKSLSIQFVTKKNISTLVELIENTNVEQLNISPSVEGINETSDLFITLDDIDLVERRRVMYLLLIFSKWIYKNCSICRQKSRQAGRQAAKAFPRDSPKRGSTSEALSPQARLASKLCGDLRASGFSRRPCKCKSQNCSNLEEFVNVKVVWNF